MLTVIGGIHLTDPKVTLKELLEDNWLETSVAPLVTVDWYDEKEETPQITISHVITTSKYLALSNDLTSAEKRCEATYAIDCWVKGHPEQRFDMVEEVKRIIKAICDAPGGGLEFIEVTDWRDLDDPSHSPKLLRSQVRVTAQYYD